MAIKCKLVHLCVSWVTRCYESISHYVPILVTFIGIERCTTTARCRDASASCNWHYPYTLRGSSFGYSATPSIIEYRVMRVVFPYHLLPVHMHRDVND